MTYKIDEQLQQDSAHTAFQLVWGRMQKLGLFQREKDLIQSGMQQYAKNFLDRHGHVKVLGMTEPVPLRDIYTAARVVSPGFLDKFRTHESLQAMFVEGGRRLFLNTSENPRRDGLELANNAQFLNVLGAPGAGKSTFLRRLGLEALLLRDTVSQYTHDCLPVLIELRRFRTEDIQIPQLIRDELAACGLPDASQLADALLKDGALLLLLDGLDEIPGDKLELALEHVRDCVDRYPNNRFVTSCRTAFYKNYFPRFTDALLADFDGEQIANFVRNWFHSVDDRQRGAADSLLAILKDPAHAAAKELASTPLLLTFLCLTYDDRQRLPANRSLLYRQAMEILLDRWAASKRVHHERIYGQLHAELEIQMLSEIAAPAFAESRYFFTRSELGGRIVEFLRNELNAPQHLDTDQIVHAIEVQQGLIVQRARDTYSFSHLTIQEYLTAVWYVNNDKLEELVDEHLFDLRWREIFILAAGLVSKADTFLLRIQRTAEKKMASVFPQAVQLLKWVDAKYGGSEDSVKQVARRAHATALALSVALSLSRAISLARSYHVDRDLAHDRARELDVDVERALALNLALDRACDSALDRALQRALSLDRAFEPSKGDFELDRPLASAVSRILALEGNYLEKLAAVCLPLVEVVGRSPTSERSSGGNPSPRSNTLPPAPVSDVSSFQTTWRQFHGILLAMADDLSLPREMLRLEPETARSLESYLTACRLIVDCRGAATRVSRTVWDDICHRMLTPAS